MVYLNPVPCKHRSRKEMFILSDYDVNYKSC